MTLFYALSGIFATWAAARWLYAVLPDGAQYRIRLAARRLYLLPLLAAGCSGGHVAGTGGHTTSTAPACGPACVPGAFAVCEPIDITGTPCCDEHMMTIAPCARLAGILTHDCAPTCVSQECAISPMGTETCCDGSATDPCGKAVP